MARAPRAAPAGAGPDADREYYYVQDMVTSYNQDCLEIKKWSVTTASIVAVIGQLGLRYLEPVLLVIIALAIGFWVTETIWRMNQWAFIRIINDMESHGETGPQISAGWAKFYLPANHAAPTRRHERSLAGFWSHFKAPITLLPHAVIVAFAALAFAYVYFGGIRLDKDDAKPLSGMFDVTLHQPKSAR